MPPLTRYLEMNNYCLGKFGIFPSISFCNMCCFLYRLQWRSPWDRLSSCWSCYTTMLVLVPVDRKHFRRWLGSVVWLHGVYLLQWQRINPCVSWFVRNGHHIGVSTTTWWKKMFFDRRSLPKSDAKFTFPGCNLWRCPGRSLTTVGSDCGIFASINDTHITMFSQPRLCYVLCEPSSFKFTHCARQVPE